MTQRAPAVGDGVDSGWIGRRVIGDTMLGDGVCRRCRKGRQNVRDNRQGSGSPEALGALA